MMRLAVTGVGGLVGRALLDSLRRDPGPVTHLIGFDVRPPTDLVGDADAALGADAHADARADAAHRGGLGGLDVELAALDVRDPALDEALGGVDVLVHLAFQLDPIRDIEDMRSINVEGTRAVMEAARAAGVPRVIYLSSVLAYDGAEVHDGERDSEGMLLETSPLRASGGFAYASHKREVEAWLWPWHAAGSGPALTVLRSAAVLGPGVQNFVTRALEQPVVPEVPHAPPLQFVHVDDVVGAIVHAVRTPIDGAFNVAPDGGIDFQRTVTLCGRPTVAMRVDQLQRLAERAHRLGLLEVDPGVVDLFRCCWVMSNARLRATGWVPTRSNEEALLDTMREHAGYLAIGRFRVRRRTLQATGLAAIAGLAAVSAARRGHRA